MQSYSRLLIILVINLLLFSCSYPLLAQEQAPETNQDTDKKFIPLGNIAVLGSYSKVCGGSDLSGLYTSANFAPAVKLGPGDFIIPLYNGLYTKQRQIVNEEEGGQLYTTMMSHNISFMHKHLFSDLFTQRLTGFVSLNYNKETSNESFGDGLYDYRDYGAFLDYQYRLFKTETATVTLLYGGKYYFRKYPNFQSLISLAQPTAPEEDEKDQHVWGINSRYTHKFADKLIINLSYDVLFKRFADKLTIGSDGILIEDKKRRDKTHYIKLNSGYRINKNFVLGLDGEIELNNSNQNHYDSMETPLVLGDDIFVPHYFNYNRYEIKPSVTYLFPLKEKKNIILKVTYGYTVRDYPNRNIRNSQGAYTSQAQEDHVHAGYLNINFPLTEKLSFLVNADYSHTASNMEYERYYLYDYDIYHILSGLSYKF